MPTSLLKRFFGSANAQEKKLEWSAYIHKAIRNGEYRNVSYGLANRKTFNPHDIDVATATMNHFYETNYIKGERQALKELSAATICLQWSIIKYPIETWAYLTTPSKYQEVMPVHEILGSRVSSTNDIPVSAIRDPLLMDLEKLAGTQHNWEQESKLPKEEQFLYKIVSRQSADKFDGVAIPADSLGYWMRKFNLQPSGWEGEFIMHMVCRRNFSNTEDIATIFDMPNISITVPIEGRKGSPLEGTTNNNILHMIAFSERHSSLLLLYYLRDKGFKDHPNSAGLYGTQCILKYNRDLNIMPTAKSLFGLQLPPLVPDVDCVPSPLQKLINARVLTSDLNTVRNLQYAERLGTGDVRNLIDDKSLVLYAFSINDAPLLNMAIHIGDTPSDNNNGPAHTNLYKVLTLWGQDPQKYQAVTKELMMHLNKPIEIANHIEVLYAVTTKYPNYDWGLLPIDGNSVLMEEMKSISPTLHDHLISSRQLQLDI